MSTSGYHDWVAHQTAGPTERQVAEAALVALTRDVLRRQWQLRGEGRCVAGSVVSREWVAHLMRLHGIASRLRRHNNPLHLPGPDGIIALQWSLRLT